METGVASKPEAVNFIVVSCCSCHNVMSDDREWFDGCELLDLIPKRLISHTICPSCFPKLYPDMHEKFLKRAKQSLDVPLP